MSTTMMPDQVAAIADLLKTPGAVAVEVAECAEWSLRVALYMAREDRDPEEPPADARWFSISVCGTVREIAPTPDTVAA